MADAGVAGYFGGGDSASGLISGIDKITFPADTKTTLSATLSTVRRFLGAFADSAVAGYFAGGANPTIVDIIQKVAFPADTVTTLSATLTTVRVAVSGMSNEGSF
jgi:hypothetical protein